MTSLAIRNEPEASYINTPYVLPIAIISNEIQLNLYKVKHGVEQKGFVFDGGSCTFDLGDEIVVVTPPYESYKGCDALKQFVETIVHEANHVKQFIYRFIGEDMPVSQISEIDSCFLDAITGAMASILM